MALFFVFLKSWALSFVKKNHGFLFFCLFVLELVREGVIFLDFLESGCFWLMNFFFWLFRVERRRQCTSHQQLMTRSCKAPWRELGLMQFQLLKKWTSLRMIWLFSLLTLKSKPLLLPTHGLLQALLKPEVSF